MLTSLLIYLFLFPPPPPSASSAYTDTLGAHPSPGALSPLASYDLMGRSKRANALARSDTAWFQTAVNAIVRRVSTSATATSAAASSSSSAASTPFLQMVSRRPGLLGGPQLSSMQLSDKAAWAAAAKQLGAMSADCVVLVQPVDNAESACVTGCERMQQASDAPGTSSPRSDYSGRVGDCCDGSSSDHHGHSHAHHSSSNVSSSGGSRNVSSHGSSSGGTDSTGYWGLVVQCRGADTQHVAGCYLLKTVRSSSDPGCQCTHWSVTRVCQNAPLQQQLRRSWLAA